MQITWTTIEGVKWCSDERDNFNSVHHFGTEENAERALRTLQEVRQMY